MWSLCDLSTCLVRPFTVHGCYGEANFKHDNSQPEGQVSQETKMKAADILMTGSAAMLPSVCYVQVPESGVCIRLAYQTVECVGPVRCISHDLLAPFTSVISIFLVFLKFSERLVILSISQATMCKANPVAFCKSWRFWRFLALAVWFISRPKLQASLLPVVTGESPWLPICFPITSCPCHYLSFSIFLWFLKLPPLLFTFLCPSLPSVTTRLILLMNILSNYFSD